MDWSEALVPYFEYFEQHYLFFSTMLASKEAKGAPSSFRTRLLYYFMEGFKGEIDKESERNHNLSEEIMLQYAGTAYVGVIEWWIRNGMPHPPQAMAKQVGALLERTL